MRQLPATPSPFPRLHAAWVRADLLDLILSGLKTVESRLSRARGPAFRRVSAGDALYFREIGGPFRASALVLHAEHFDGLDPADVRRLRRLVGPAVAADPGYWTSRRACRYATLVWLTSVRSVRSGPACERWAGFNRRAGWATWERPGAARWIALAQEGAAASSFSVPDVHA